MNLIRPRSHRKSVQNQLTGALAGIETEHWDDSQDAVAFARRGLLVPEHGLLITPDGVLSVISGGAFASGMYVDNYIDVLDGTQLAIDLSLTTHKWALYTDTLTPNFSTDTQYSATNEVSGTGYTAGGQTIVSPTTTESPAGTLMYDMDNQVWAAPTTVTARGGILYADALAGNNLIVASGFGSDIASTAGTFTISFAATGVFTIDLTP